jgi:hypothetical protein
MCSRSAVAGSDALGEAMLQISTLVKIPNPRLMIVGYVVVSAVQQRGKGRIGLRQKMRPLQRLMHVVM